MENLKQNNFQTALDLLRQAEQLLSTAKVPEDIRESEKAKLLALTYNNIGCFYKKKNQSNVALKYLKSALDLETASQQDAMNIAGTMLNICAILSHLKQYRFYFNFDRHKKAVFYAKNAIMKTESALHKVRSAILQQQFNKLSNQEGDFEIEQQKIYLKNIYTTRAICLYNLGVEHEYLSELGLALDKFNEALDIINEQLDGEPQMMKLLTDAKMGVQQKIMQKQNLTSQHIQFPEPKRENSRSKVQIQPQPQQPQYHELNITQSSRGSFNLQSTKNQKKLNQTVREEEHQPQIAYTSQSEKQYQSVPPKEKSSSQPHHELKEEIGNFRKQIYQKWQMMEDEPGQYKKMNLLTNIRGTNFQTLDPSNRVVQSYRKAASVMSIKEKEYTSRLSMSEIEEEQTSKVKKIQSKRHASNKSTLNKTQQVHREVNLPKLNRGFYGDEDSNQDQHILASSNSTKVHFMQPKGPIVQNNKRLLLDEINEKMKISKMQSDQSRERNKQQKAFHSQKQDSPYKPSNKFESPEKFEAQKQAIGQSPMNQTVNGPNIQQSMRSISDRINQLHQKMSNYKEDQLGGDLVGGKQKNAATNVSGDEDAMSAYNDRIPHR